MYTEIRKIPISIIIPLYNAEKEISRCMESIYKQTFTDYEIILVNDGSVDNSAEICRKYADKDSRVTFIDKENGGSGSARNAGIEVACGKYIYFCDADDEISNTLLERIYNVAENNNCDLVVFSVHSKIINSDTGNIIKEYYTTKKDCILKSKADFRNNFSHLYYEGVLFGAPYNKLFSNDIIKRNNVRFPDLKRGQDEIFNMRYYRFVNSCAVIPDSLYTYYQFDTIGRNKKYRLNYFKTTTKTYFATLKDLLDEFRAHDDYTEKKFQNSFVYSMESGILLAWNPIEKLNKKEKISFIKEILKTDFVIDISKTIIFVPEDYEKFWQLFIRGDYKSVYKYINRNERIEKIKSPIRKLRNSIIKRS